MGIFSFNFCVCINTTTTTTNPKMTFLIEITTELFCFIRATRAISFHFGKTLGFYSILLRCLVASLCFANMWVLLKITTKQRWSDLELFSSDTMESLCHLATTVSKMKTSTISRLNKPWLITQYFSLIWRSNTIWRHQIRLSPLVDLMVNWMAHITSYLYLNKF